jgi:sugar phosphate isomerase/epimerase
VGHQGRYKELLARVKPAGRGTEAGRLAYNDITHALIDGLGNKILHLHVHDIDPQTWQEHRPLGTGFVDYQRLIAKLRHIAYRGLLVLEIAGPGEKIEAMLKDSKHKLEAFL